ncbi:MAG: hypothetical protein CR988_02360 [Treponema sp.]|nr:MAG: hypothetical protein CR988_02360 [Treponema sp.]
MFDYPVYAKGYCLIVEDIEIGIDFVVVEMTGETMNAPSFWGFGRVGVIVDLNEDGKATVEFKPNVIKTIDATNSSFIIEGGELKRSTGGFLPMVVTIGKIIDDSDLSAVKVELNMSGRHYYKP